MDVIEKQATDDLLDKGGLEFKIGRIRLRVRKIKLGTMLSMSRHIGRMKDLDDNKGLIQNLFENAKNLYYASRLVALGITNSFFLNWLSRPLAVWLRWKLDNGELLRLTQVVTKQMQAQEFFFTMTLTKGIVLTKRIDSEEAKASTGASQ